MYITMIEPLDGSVLRKRRMLCPDGQVITLPEDPLTRGRASVWEVPYASLLASALDATTEQAVVLGLPCRAGGRGPWWIVTKAEVADASRGRPDVLARTLDYFGWPAGPGWLLIDVDVPIERPLELLQYIWPEIAEASIVVRPSSSHGTAPGKAGLHIFVLVAQVDRSRLMLEELARRAAYVGVPDAIDVLVGSPERIVYVAPPILLNGATRTAPATWWKEGCAIGMANIVEPEREVRPSPVSLVGELADPALWPGDLVQAVEGYLLSVVHGLCGDIGRERKGKRSLRLYSSGARLGNYAWTGSRALTGAGDLLLEAADACGYFDDYRPEIAQGHLARGWAEGCTKPECGLPMLLRWQRRDEILARGAALLQIMQRSA